MKVVPIQARDTKDAGRPLGLGTLGLVHVSIRRPIGAYEARARSRYRFDCGGPPQGGDVAQLRYFEYRSLQARRQQANSSIMALLAGSKLAVNTLQLTRGSIHQLSEIYTEVEHIERFNLRTDTAMRILDEAENHLAVMAVPYVMALHEDYMSHCCQLLASVGLLSSSRLSDLNAKNMHRTFENASGGTVNAVDLQLFQVLRCLRNSLIHSGGVASEELEQARWAVGAAGEARWMLVARESLPPFAKGSIVQVGQFHIIATLAITSTLMKDANSILTSCVPREIWADRALQDALVAGQGAVGNPNQRLRSLRRFINRYYLNLQLGDAELIAAGFRIGLRLKE